jgi:sugar lactone lactonase YvrE
VKFDPSKGELPEGLAVRDGATYVGFAPTASIVKVDGTGKRAAFATLPTTFGGTKGYTLGLGFDPPGALYALEASFDPASVQAGVYKIPASGGDVTEPWAKDPMMTFPNGIAFDAAGKAYVADSGGSIFTIDGSGTVKTWSSDPLLKGDPGACPGLLPIPIGANGVAVTSKELWVTNTDKGYLLRFPIDAEGKAGPVQTVLSGCSYAGADGLVVDPSDGSVVVAINGPNKIVRVTPAGNVTELWNGAPLDFPASLAIEHGALWITGAAFVSAQTKGAMPAPALLKYAPFS